jgi:hypothetical protein
MQRSMKKMKIAAPALVAAAFGGFIGCPLAHADFSISISTPMVIGGNSEYVVSATNNGANGTGSTITAEDLTVTTPGSGTSGALVIDIGDINGDGVSDADVDGSPITANYYSVDKDTTSTVPAFGARTASKAFTMIGVGGAFTGSIATSTPTGSSSSPAVNVYVNSQTSPNNGGLAGTPAVYLTSGNTIDPSFTNGTVHSLEVVAKSSSPPVASSTPVAVANVVVPTGTSFTVSGSLGGEIGLSQNVSASLGVTPTAGAKLSLSTTGTGTNVGTLSVTPGSNGSYTPAKVTGITGAGATTGNVSVTGFNPVSDKEVYALAVDSGGTLASGATLTAILADLNTALGTSGTAEALSGGTPAIGSIFNPAAWNVELVFPTGPSSSPAFLSYDFSGDTINPGLTITAVGVVPEPTGLGVLALGGMGLLARRRRMSQLMA